MSKLILIPTPIGNLSEEIIKLHEGTKLNILESINDWSLIQLKNGNKGWILTSSFRTVK